MGWDYTHATHYTRTGAIDRKTEIDELYTWQNDTRKAEVVRSARIEKFTCRRSDPLYSPHWGKYRTIETRRGVSVQTPFLVLPIIRPLYASNQDPGKL